MIEKAGYIMFDKKNRTASVVDPTYFLILSKPFSTLSQFTTFHHAEM